MTRSVILTDEELVLLDGRCTDKVQREVDAAKARLASAAALPDLPAAIAGFVADAVREARESGRLVMRRAAIVWCPVCKRDAGYFVHKRSGRYHKKGDTDHSKPRTMSAIELADRFITISQRVAVGCCLECWAQAEAPLAEALRGVPVELPAHWKKRPHAMKRHDARHCKKCDWRGYENEMGRDYALMGSGTYPSTCPKCGAKNLPFGSHDIETVGGFVVLPEVTP